jgi:hypothetical protein
MRVPRGHRRQFRGSANRDQEILMFEILYASLIWMLTGQIDESTPPVVANIGLTIDHGG